MLNRRAICPASETVLVGAQLKGPFPALHHTCDRVSNLGYVDRTLIFFNLTSRLFTSDSIIAVDHKLGIAVHDEVCVVTREDELTMALCVPNLLDDVDYDFAIEVILRLIDN